MVSVKIERDRELIRRYQAGDSLKQLGDDFGITRSRIYQILKKGGIQIGDRPARVSERDLFLGINVSQSVKDALRREARRRGISMSALSADGLREMLIECGYPLEAEKIA